MEDVHEPEYVHEYERTVVIRVRYRVRSDGGAENWLRIDSDVPSRTELIGVLTRASWVVGNNGDVQHERLEVSGLPEWEPDEEEGCLED